jgi:hypothetical protein
VGVFSLGRPDGDPKRPPPNLRAPGPRPKNSRFLISTEPDASDQSRQAHRHPSNSGLSLRPPGPTRRAPLLSRTTRIFCSVSRPFRPGAEALSLPATFPACSASVPPRAKQLISHNPNHTPTPLPKGRIQSRRLLWRESPLHFQTAPKTPLSRRSPLLVNQKSIAASGADSASPPATRLSCSIRARLVVSIRTARTLRTPYFSAYCPLRKNFK